MGVANVVIKIGAETTDAVRNIGKVNTALGEQMTAGQKAAGGLKRAAVPAAAAFTLVAGAAIDFTKAAAEDADAQAELAGSLKRTTGASDKAVAGAEKYIDTLSTQVAIADDDLRPALGKLAAATGSVTKGQQQLALAADIAAQAHVPLAQATDALVMADHGRYKSLQKLVPGITDATVASKDQTKVLEEASALTAGAAAEAAGTYAGQQKAMQIQIGETEEAIGSGFLPVLQVLLSILKKVTDFARDNTTAFRAIMAAVAAVSGAILVANAAMKAYEAISIIVKAATVAWTAVQWLLNAALNANPVGLITAAVLLLVGAVVLAYKNSDTFREAVDKLWDVLRGAVRLYFTPLTTAIDIAKTAFKEAKAVFEGVIGHGPLDTLKGVVQDVKAAFDDGKAAAVTLVGYLAGAATTAFNAIAKVIDGISSAISTLISWIGRLIDWLGKVKLPKALGSILHHVPGFGMVAPSSVSAQRSRFAYASGAAGLGRGRAAATTSGSGLTINIFGALDPEGTARAVNRVLAGHARRQGRTA